MRTSLHITYDLNLIVRDKTDLEYVSLAKLTQFTVTRPQNFHVLYVYN